MGVNANQIISELKTLSYQNDTDRFSIRDYLRVLESPETNEAIRIFREHGLPELRRLLDEGMRHVNQTKVGDDPLYLMRTLAVYGSEMDAHRIVKVANSGYESDSYTWKIIFDQFNGEHPYWRVVLDGLKHPLPANFLKVVYLDFANTRFIENPTLSMVHPFDSEAGFRDLEKWLRSDNEYEYSYAFSATSALPFIRDPARSKLLKLSQSHPDSEVKIKSAWASVMMGDTSYGIQVLKKWALDVRYSENVKKCFIELGLENEIPDGAKDGDFVVLSEMANWLSHPQEYGSPPEKVEIFDKRELYWPPTNDRRPVWLIKYTYPESDWHDPVQIGMVGSITVGLRSDMTGLSVEEIYGLHCSWELYQYGDPRASGNINANEGLKILRTYNKDL